MVPYRQPAEDEQAKLDAAALRAFAGGLRRARMWTVLLAAGAGLLALGGLVGVASLLVSGSEADHRVPRGPACHTVYSFTIDGKQTIRTEQIVCPSDETAASLSTPAWSAHDPHDQ